MRQAARRIVEKLRLHGYEAFFAGGWVRDYLLRRKPNDIDIATSARPDEVLRLFPHSRNVGAQFGVIQVSMYGRQYEVATFRSDGSYEDGRHPVSVTFSSPEQDALRRDFTINGLFFDPVSGRVIDYIHGKRDIRNKRVRTIGNALERFSEDKLRMLRAIRLACELGFTIEPETWAAIQATAPGILQVSWERIRDELRKIFAGPNPASGLDWLYGSGLLHSLLPEVQAMCTVPDLFAQTRRSMALLRNPSVPLAFAVLLQEIGNPMVIEGTGPKSANIPAATGHDIAGQICRRLKLPNDEAARISHMVGSLGTFEKIAAMRVSSLKRFLRQPYFQDLLELYRLHCIGKNRELDIYDLCRRKIKEYGSQLEPQPLVSGEDLISMGYSPGPAFSRILISIEDLQLEGTLRTREDALAHIRESFPIDATTSKSEA